MSLRCRTGPVVLLAVSAFCVLVEAGNATASDVCLAHARSTVAGTLDVRSASITTAQTVGDNGMPQCVFSTTGESRVKPRTHASVTINVDDAPQAAWRLMRTVVEATQLFGPPPPGWSAPIGIQGLGPYASWFPNRDQLMAGNHVDLFTAQIRWRGADRRERIALARAAITPYVHHHGNVD
jgi:hypothetical protein